MVWQCDPFVPWHQEGKLSRLLCGTTARHICIETGCLSQSESEAESEDEELELLELLEFEAAVAFLAGVLAFLAGLLAFLAGLLAFPAVLAGAFSTSDT